MKHLLKYYSGCILSIAISLFLVSCSDDDAGSNLTSAIYPSDIDIVLTEELERLIYTDGTGATVLPLIKGETVNLSHTIAPDNITFSDVVWKSSYDNVATVDQYGTVTAVSGDGTGYSIIQVAPAEFYAGSNIFSTIKVVVSNTLTPATSISASSVTGDHEVFIGETLQLACDLLPSSATYRTVKWTSSDESVATVDLKGVVTGISTGSDISRDVVITATTLDGTELSDNITITVKKVVTPEDITIDQTYSVDNSYYCAINEKYLKLSYTTVPSYATKSLVVWTSSDETIATVNSGVVTFNQNGVFGNVTITATCPETGNSSSIRLNLAAGLIRELFHDENNYSWYNAAQSGNGTSSSHVWSYGKVTVTTYTQNATNQRGDFKCWDAKTWLHAGNYPFVAIRMDDVLDLYASEGVTARYINLDGSASYNGTTYSGNFGGDNNKYLYNYTCSDGSHVFVYDLDTQSWKNGGKLPENAAVAFTTLQFKYADIKTIDHQITYNVYWVQSFKTTTDLENYLTSEGLAFSK